MERAGSSGTQFELLHCIGRGGFGEVYRAVMVSPGGLRSEVAVKMLKGEALANSDAVARFRDEATVLAALKHRAIPRVYDVVELKGRVAMVSEYIEGADLEQLQRVQSVPLRSALQIVAEVAGALDAAYHAVTPSTGRELRLIHRDIKPANIRIARDGGVKLLDFGVARSEGIERQAQTSTGLLVGTMGYLAPERLTDERLEPSSDLFALGCVFFHMVCGERLYKGVARSQWVSMSFHADEHAAFLTRRLAGLDVDGEPSCQAAPASVRPLLLDVLAFRPEDRPTAMELVDRAEELSAQAPGASLRRFTRDCDWPAEEALDGELTGQHVNELSLLLDSDVVAVSAAQPSLVAAAPSGPTTSVDRQRLVVGGMMVSAAGLAAGIALVGLLVGGLVVWATWNPGDGQVVRAPAPVETPPASAPAPREESTVPAPLSPPEEPVEAPAPHPEPPVAQPPAPTPPAPTPPAPTPLTPRPAARPAASAPPPGRVQVRGPIVAAELSAGDTRQPVGEVPAGTYTLLVRFENYDEEVTVPKPLVVPSGADIVVECVGGFFTCKW